MTDIAAPDSCSSHCAWILLSVHELVWKCMLGLINYLSKSSLLFKLIVVYKMGGEGAYDCETTVRPLKYD